MASNDIFSKQGDLDQETKKTVAKCLISVFTVPERLHRTLNSLFNVFVFILTF